MRHPFDCPALQLARVPAAAEVRAQQRRVHRGGGMPLQVSMFAGRCHVCACLGPLAAESNPGGVSGDAVADWPPAGPAPKHKAKNTNALVQNSGQRALARAPPHKKTRSIHTHP